MIKNSSKTYSRIQKLIPLLNTVEIRLNKALFYFR